MKVTRNYFVLSHHLDGLPLGHPRKPESEKFEQRSSRLTPAQWAKVDANGGQEWLRQVVEQTEVPALLTKKPAYLAGPSSPAGAGIRP